MKKLMVLTLTLVLIAAMAVTTANAQEVNIPDDNLAAVIRETLDLPAGAAITADAMRKLTWLNAPGRGIADLTGLEHAVNLQGLNLDTAWIDNELGVNPISNVSPLAGLTNLETLNLTFTGVSDVSPLASLTNLETLELNVTAVSDVSPLASLTNLTWLELSGTGVSDVSPLATLTNLETLRLDYTAVSDVSPLASLTNLVELNLYRTAVSDVSPLATLTNLERLELNGTAVSDISPLASLTNLERLNLWDCPLTAAAHQTHIPAIQANGTKVLFYPFTSIHLPRVQSLVSLIYFRPSDIPVRPNVDAEIDWLIKKAQRFFADEMERHGFGRKTFQFEADANGNAVVHHVNGKFTEAHYRQNRGWDDHEIREQIYIPPENITVYMLGGNLLPSGGNGSGFPYDGGSANINSWGWRTIAHELGHAFGMGYHDHRDLSLMSYQGFDGSLSPCFAAWLDVHPAFNPTVVRRHTRATIQMLPATLAAPPNSIRLRFTVTAPAGSLYQARLLTPEKNVRMGYNFNSGGLIGCKRIDGNPTNSTVEFVTALTPDTESVALEIIGIDGGGVGSALFLIDVASLLGTENAPELVADVNGDGVVNIQDLVLVAGQFGKTGEHVADVNGDGVVNIQDLVLVAGAFGEGAAAPSVRAVSRARLTVSDVEGWLIEARAVSSVGQDRLILTSFSRQTHLVSGSGSGDPELQSGSASRPGGLSYGRGIAVLERLLASLMPKETVLLANYPNPFNPETWIPYQLSEPAEVTVTIYAANGAVVRMLDLGHRRAGSYDSRGRAAYWDGRNAAGESVASGVYFYTLSAGDFSATRKMVIRK